MYVFPFDAENATNTYPLKPGTPAIRRGLDAGTVYRVRLWPDGEYEHSLKMRARSTARSLDPGALEYRR